MSFENSVRYEQSTPRHGKLGQALLYALVLAACAPQSADESQNQGQSIAESAPECVTSWDCPSGHFCEPDTLLCQPNPGRR